MGPKCVGCGAELAINQTGSYREIRGWEMIRAKGGAHAISLREETGRVMCRGCVERKKLNERAGISDDQTSMNV